MGKILRILVVDDAIDLRDLIGFQLRDNSYEVIGAGCVQEALAQFDFEGSFDLIISDFHMPGGTGIDLFNSLQERGSEAPFILMSGDLQLSSAEIRALGIASFLPKPFNSEVLCKSVESALAACVLRGSSVVLT